MNPRGAGGTPGGVGAFLIGCAMSVVGAYLLTSHITVGGGSWTLWGYSSFGLLLLPCWSGSACCSSTANGRSLVGWGLLGAGLLIIFAGVIVNLQVYFRQTNLFDTLIMFGLLAGGVGLVARSIRAS